MHEVPNAALPKPKPKPAVAASVLAAGVLAAGTAGFAAPAGAANWYVDGVAGGDQYSAGSQSRPFSVLWMALQHAKPGDTIYVVPSMTYPQLPLMISGAAAAPIRLAGSDPAHPTKVSGGGVASGIWVDGNYLMVRNFDVTAPGNYPAVSIAPNFHHIVIDANVIHDAGGNGVNTVANDYITVSNNTVYGNAKNTATAYGSGISLMGSVDVDGYTGVKMRVTGNVIYGNTNTPRCATAACLATTAALNSDGNGVILDDNQRRQWDHVPYKGAFLVANNVIFLNGGRGVHVFRSDNAAVTGNTMWHNNQDPYEGFWHPGEVAVVQGGNVAVSSNILYSDGANSPNMTGTAPNSHVMVNIGGCTDGVGPVTAQNNIGYNPQNDSSQFSYARGNTNPVTIAANGFTDPLLSNPAKASFWFRSTSQAYRAATVPVPISIDILGASRGAQPSIGAYQNPGP